MNYEELDQLLEQTVRCLNYFFDNHPKFHKSMTNKPEFRCVCLLTIDKGFKISKQELQFKLKKEIDKNLSKPIQEEIGIYFCDIEDDFMDYKSMNYPDKCVVYSVYVFQKEIELLTKVTAIYTNENICIYPYVYGQDYKPRKPT